MNFIVSRRFDLCFIIGPAFLSSMFVSLFVLLGFAPETTSPLYWLIFVVFIDVSHVWSTLFRTYLHKENRLKYQKILWLVPISCYGVGVILHSFGHLIFWRVLAYLAVFHFIRQQFGIFNIYRFKEELSKKIIVIDKLAIYSGTLIPIIIWHLSGPQSINWFLSGDFLYFPNVDLIIYFEGIALLIIILYFSKELFILKNSIFVPKNLFLIGTYLSWWLGIVWLNSDWAFTITNVVSHGIPYFALIYHYDLKNKSNITWWKTMPTISIFIFLFFLGYIEEGLWDIFIWKDHSQIFPFFVDSQAIDSLELLSLVVPLLTLPQATHYILDGFIWKRSAI